MAKTLTERTYHGIKWSYFSMLVTALMQIVYTAVMARLLNPKDFGLVAMGGIVLRFGQYFSEMGMGSAIIQKDLLSEKQINSVFSASVFIGIGFSILAFILAPFSKYLFNNEDLIPLVKIMGLSFSINGFALTAMALLKKELKFKSIAIAEIISFGSGYLIIGIGSAFLGHGVWSLVFASLFQGLLLALIAFILNNHKLILYFSWQHYKPLFHYGSKISGISFLEFVSSSIDTVLIGRYFGSERLGLYNRSQMLINLPFHYITSSLSRVLFPSFSQIQNDNEKLKRTMILILQIAAVVIFPLAILVSILSKEIVWVLLGPKWLEAALFIKILAFAASFNLLAHFIAVMFEAKSLLKQKIIIQLIFIAILSFLFYLSYEAGIIGIALSLLVCQFLYLVHYNYYFLKEFNIKIGEYLKEFAASIYTSLIILFTTFICHKILSMMQLSNFIILFLTLSQFGIVYVILIFSKFNFKIKNALLHKYEFLKET